MPFPTTYTALDQKLFKALINARDAQQAGLPDTNKYVSIIEFALINGMFFQSIPLNFNVLSWVKKLISQIQKSIVKGNVYTNAMALCLADTTNTLNYHEGFVISKGTLSPHAWCVLDGRVIDIDSNESDDSVIGTFKHSSYFGVSIPKSEVRENYLKQVELSKDDPRQGILSYTEEKILSISKPPQTYEGSR